MSAIVIYYSRAAQNYFSGEYRYIEIGNTEKVAREIARIKNADLFKIEQITPYADDYEVCIAQAKSDLQASKRPSLKDLPDIENYDEIYLGYPNYWGTMPMAVYTLLESIDFKGKIIHPFCTHEGSGLSSTVKDIKGSAKGAKVEKGLAIKGSSADNLRSLLERWL